MFLKEAAAMPLEVITNLLLYKTGHRFVAFCGFYVYIDKPSLMSAIGGKRNTRYVSRSYLAVSFWLNSMFIVKSRQVAVNERLGQQNQSVVLQGLCIALALALSR